MEVPVHGDEIYGWAAIDAETFEIDPVGNFTESLRPRYVSFPQTTLSRCYSELFVLLYQEPWYNSTVNALDFLF